MDAGNDGSPHRLQYVGIHQLLRRLPDLLCEYAQSLALRYILDRIDSGIFAVLRWNVLRPGK